MGQPYKTIYLSTAANSQSSSQIQYWHVLNLKEDLDLTKPDSNIEVVNAISTGPDRFSYTYADKYINK